MKEIIPSQVIKSNNYLSSLTIVRSETTRLINSIRDLTSLEFKMLIMYHQDHQAGYTITNRSLSEIANRFQVSRFTASRTLNALESFDLIKSYGLSIGRFKRRGITVDGFTLLENQSATQTATQMIPIPYIDLLSEGMNIQEISNPVENRDNFTIEQEQITDERILRQRLDKLLMAKGVELGKIVTIQNAFKHSKLNLSQRISLFYRISHQLMRQTISHLAAYILKAISNTEECIRKVKFAFQRC